MGTPLINSLISANNKFAPAAQGRICPLTVAQVAWATCAQGLAGIRVFLAFWNGSRPNPRSGQNGRMR
jgi:hypothetical protein